MVLPANASAWVDRLLTWLEPLEAAFGHMAQCGAFRRYLLGLLSDSPRKSMSAMLARVSDPGDYQAFQHFITSAPWSADALWQGLRDQMPVREGVLIFDGTSFPKQGPHSVGVARQYCGALGKLANCQVAVAAALWTGTQAWLLGAQLYLPESWTTPAARARGRIPRTVPFREKWRQALTLLHQLGAAGVRPTAVLADAEFGDNSIFRRVLHRAGLPYAVGIASTQSVFVGAPRLPRPTAASGRPGRPHRRPTLPTGVAPVTVAALVATWPTAAWRRITWSNAPDARRCGGRFAAQRVTPAHDWRQRALAPEIWLLAEQVGGATPRTKYYFVHLAATASLCTLVQLTHQRRAIEQQYQELKDELDLDHFVGRSWPGWHRHVVLTAIAYTFLQVERRRRARTRPTLRQIRTLIQEVLTAHFFVTRPHYLQRMLKLQAVSLRI
jgi:SRSO17 transposase